MRQLTRERVQVLTLQQTQHCTLFLLRGPTASFFTSLSFLLRIGHSGGGITLAQKRVQKNYIPGEFPLLLVWVHRLRPLLSRLRLPAGKFKPRKPVPTESSNV